MAGNETFRCYYVTKDAQGNVRGDVTSRPIAELPPGDVRIRVRWSSLNYKDALAATGHPGVAKTLPHVPGIDAAGEVIESNSPQFRAGQSVIVTGYELGAGQWGGWAEQIRVPAEWVFLPPESLSAREAMILGTAGITAGLSVQALERQGVTTDKGEVVVTGATGGVGSLAVKLLAKLGYRVVAVSGKKDKEPWLRALGAARVIGREEVSDSTDRPLLKAVWAGAADTVGGKTLATLLRSTQVGGCVAAMGLVGGADLPLTVYPFILRGVTLAGITSSWSPHAVRQQLWQDFAGKWKLEGLGDLAQEADLAHVGEFVPRILTGQITGRVVVRIS
ncbi:MAG: YhdH/YhfP family quinone oxidoreductase [Planctomycetia bacterium]|nr:YhdH/YhfP family quinone oxidoreductase [Planctomycetia bacterium]